MPDVRAVGCRLSWTVQGPADAPPLLLLNALGTTIDLWTPQIDRFAAAFRVIRFDTRGHGASEAPPGPYTLDRLGKDALAVLNAAEVSDAHVCGVSLGGQTALRLALHAPDRVSGIVAANTAARIGSADLWQQRMRDAADRGMPALAQSAAARWFTPGFRQAHPETVDRCTKMLRACSPVGYAGCCAALRDADLREDLRRIRSPTLVVTGARDPATPPAEGAFLREQIAGAELLELDAAHLANVEQPDAFTAAVLRFLSRVAPQ